MIFRKEWLHSFTKHITYIVFAFNWPDLHQTKMISNDSWLLFPTTQFPFHLYGLVSILRPTHHQPQQASHQSHDLVTRPWNRGLTIAAVLPSPLTYWLPFLVVDSFTTWQIYNFKYFIVTSIETWMNLSGQLLLNCQVGIKSVILIPLIYRISRWP